MIRNIFFIYIINTITNWRVSLSKICHEWPNNTVTHECAQCMSELQRYSIIIVFHCCLICVGLFLFYFYLWKDSICSLSKNCFFLFLLNLFFQLKLFFCSYVKKLIVGFQNWICISNDLCFWQNLPPDPPRKNCHPTPSFKNESTINIQNLTKIWVSYFFWQNITMKQ